MSRLFAIFACLGLVAPTAYALRCYLCNGCNTEPATDITEFCTAPPGGYCAYLKYDNSGVGSRFDGVSGASYRGCLSTCIEGSLIAGVTTTDGDEYSYDTLCCQDDLCNAGTTFTSSSSLVMVITVIAAVLYH